MNYKTTTFFSFAVTIVSLTHLTAHDYARSLVRYNNSKKTTLHLEHHTPSIPTIVKNLIDPKQLEQSYKKEEQATLERFLEYVAFKNRYDLEKIFNYFSNVEFTTDETWRTNAFHLRTLVQKNAISEIQSLLMAFYTRAYKEGINSFQQFHSYYDKRNLFHGIKKDLALQHYLEAVGSAFANYLYTTVNANLRMKTHFAKIFLKFDPVQLRSEYTSNELAINFALHHLHSSTKQSYFQLMNTTNRSHEGTSPLSKKRKIIIALE